MCAILQDGHTVVTVAVDFLSTNIRHVPIIMFVVLTNSVLCGLARHSSNKDGPSSFTLVSLTNELAC